MNTKYNRSEKGRKHYDVGIDTVIERVKKARALGCSPSSLGMDSYICKKLLSNRPDLLTRYF